MADPLTTDLASLRIARDDDAERGRGRGAVLLALAVVVAGTGAWLVGYPLLEARLFKTEVAFTEVMLVSPAQGSTELTATGYVTAQTTSHVAARLPGRIARVFVREGDHVAQGQPIMQLDDTEQRSLIAAANMRLLAAQARAQSARASLAEVQAQLARNERLLAQSAVGKATVEDLAARSFALAESAKASLADARVARADLETAQVNLRLLTVRAPIAGTVTTRPPSVGEAAGPASGFIDLADFSTLEVETDVPEGRLSATRIGGPCEVALDAFPGRRHRAQVTSFGHRVNRQKASVTVRVRLVDPVEGVLPDMAARVSFLSKALDAQAVNLPSKVVVPESAIAERGGGKVVFVADAGGVVHMTAVQLGPPAPGGLELTKGPPPGTRLVKSPPATLADGRSVKEKRD